MGPGSIPNGDKIFAESILLFTRKQCENAFGFSAIHKVGIFCTLLLQINDEQLPVQ